MVTIILLTLALYLVHMLLPPAFDYVFQGKFVEGFSARDTAPPATLKGSRARRAHANMTENILLFLPLALLSLHLGKAEGLATTGALIFLAARVAYLPLYLYGVPNLRSYVWVLGLVALLVMGIALV